MQAAKQPSTGAELREHARRVRRGGHRVQVVRPGVGLHHELPLGRDPNEGGDEGITQRRHRRGQVHGSIVRQHLPVQDCHAIARQLVTKHTPSARPVGHRSDGAALDGATQTLGQPAAHDGGIGRVRQTRQEVVGREQPVAHATRVDLDHTDGGNGLPIAGLDSESVGDHTIHARRPALVLRLTCADRGDVTRTRPSVLELQGDAGGVERRRETGERGVEVVRERPTDERLLGHRAAPSSTARLARASRSAVRPAQSRLATGMRRAAIFTSRSAA